MAKESGKKSFLDFFKVKELDEDEFDDDLFDEDDDDEDDEDDYAPVKPQRSKKTANKKQSVGAYNQNQGYAQSQANYDSYNRQPRGNAGQNRVVDFNNPRPKTAPSRSEVYVMVPHDSSESQTVADFLKAGRTIVLNMAGLDTVTAQRIIDFVAGSCYALDGSLQAISDNIFIAAPSTIDVSGDLRALVNENQAAPNLYRY